MQELAKGCKASIIIPIYNTEKYIKRAVESVCSQTFQDFEILLVDDGSSDSSWQICKTLARQNPAIRCFHQKNAGVGAARNTGLEKARGEYLFFLDSDDEWKEGLLEGVISVFERSGCDHVRFQAESTNESLLMFRLPEEAERTYSQKEFLIKSTADSGYYLNVGTCWAGGYRRNIIENAGLRFSEELAHGEDGKFVVEYLLNCREIVYLKDVFYRYYVSFEEDARISATSRENKILYDEYELCFLLFEKIYLTYRDKYTEDEKKVVYAAFYDRMIGRLVRYASYANHLKWREKRRKMARLSSSEVMKDTAKYYHPFRKSDSRFIPYFLRREWMFPLWMALLARRGRYYKIYGRKKCLASIYRGGMG